MAKETFFPAFMSLKDKKVLLVGGGGVAHRKLLRLLDFTSNVFIVAQEISDEMMATIERHALQYEKRKYHSSDLEAVFIVVVAVDDIALQKEIFEQSRECGCLCNVVDSIAYCDFIFPAYIKEGDMTIAISTSGSAPAFAKHLKRYVQKLLPKNITPFLEEMKRLRQELPKGKERMRLLDAKAQQFFGGDHA